MRPVSQRQAVWSMWSAWNSPPPSVTNSFIIVGQALAPILGALGREIDADELESVGQPLGERQV